MEFRELSAVDRDAATALWAATGLTRPWNDPGVDFDRALTGRTSSVLGAFDDHELVATAMVGDDGHRGWVYYLAVDPDRHDGGLGRRMMAEAERWLRERGVVKVNLMVRRDNDAARGFYERLGYRDAETTVLARWLRDPPRG
jgi:ribosomal protein S18 acetylase RimI-like enzyme